MITLADRYIAKKLIKCSLLVIFIFFSLFVLIDYVSRASALISSTTTYGAIALYYLLILIKRIEILLPFALLIASITTLYSLMLHNELIPLLSSGLSLRRITRPFWVIALIASSLLLAIAQWGIPYVSQAGKLIGQNSNRIEAQGLTQINFDDGSFLLASHFDRQSRVLSNVYLINSVNDLYQMETLEPDSTGAVARNVDHFKAVDGATLMLTERSAFLTFPHLDLSPGKLTDAIAPDQLALSQLWSLSQRASDAGSDRQATLLTMLTARLATPFLALLALIAPIPFLTSYARNKSPLPIYITSLLLSILFFTLLDTAKVISFGQLVHPVLGVLTPFALYFAVFGWKWARMR